MSIVSSIEWEACLLEPRPDAELKRQVERETGLAPPSVVYFSPVPRVAGMIGRLGQRLRTRSYLDPHLADLAGLVVSQDNSCRFCYAYQRAMMRSFGFSEDRIEDLERGFAGADIDPKHKRALDFVRKVSRSNPLPSRADKESLRDAGFSEMEILELIAQIGLFIFHNRLATVPALPYARMEELPELWYAKLFRPLMGLYIRRLFPQGGELQLEDHERTGPFSSVVVAFDGLPFSRALRDAIDVTLEDGALRGRSKLMLFAVVARALGCPITETEATSLLVDEHGMDADTIQHVLAHLMSPELDEMEALIVPFARDTVWYNQATPIQHRARELRDQLKLEPFLEMVSAVSVANMVCRLGVAVDGGARTDQAG